MTGFTNEELKILLKNEEFDNFIYVVKQMSKNDIIDLLKYLYS